MPNSDSIVAHADVPQPTFVCSHTNPGRGAAWVHVAGELDMATTPQQVTRVPPSDGSNVILSSETTVAFSLRSVAALPGSYSTIW